MRTSESYRSDGAGPDSFLLYLEHTPHLGRSQRCSPGFGISAQSCAVQPLEWTISEYVALLSALRVCMSGIEHFVKSTHQEQGTPHAEQVCYHHTMFPASFLAFCIEQRSCVPFLFATPKNAGCFGTGLLVPWPARHRRPFYALALICSVPFHELLGHVIKTTRLRVARVLAC